VGDLQRAGIAQPRERDMRRELARIGRHAETLADAFDLRLQRIEVGRGRDAGPYRMRLLLSESADTRQRQRKRGAVDTVQRIGDLVGDMAFDIADEAQRQMVILDIDPAGAGQAAPEQGE